MLRNVGGRGGGGGACIGHAHYTHGESMVMTHGNNMIVIIILLWCNHVSSASGGVSGRGGGGAATRPFGRTDADGLVRSSERDRESAAACV